MINSNKNSSLSFIKRAKTIKLPPFNKTLFWVIDFKDINEEDIEESKKYVDNTILDRSSEFVFSCDQQKFLITHANLKFYLTEHLGEEPVITKNSYGKPFIINNPCHFNLSHTKEWAFLAIHSHSIGVDIEAYQRIESDPFWISYRERELMAERPLILLWCAKEALIKAIGCGFSRPLPSFIHIDCPQKDTYLFETESLKVFVYTHIIDQHVLAVCSGEEE